MEDPILHIQMPEGDVNLEVTPEQPVTIGRHARNQLSLDDHRVSRFHCIIVRIENAVHVVDLQSSNGTLINGTPISFAPLKFGDVMEIGRTRITLAHALEEHPPKPIPRPPPRPMPEQTDADSTDSVGDYVPSSVGDESGFTDFPPQRKFED